MLARGHRILTSWVSLCPRAGGNHDKAARFELVDAIIRQHDAKRAVPSEVAALLSLTVSATLATRATFHAVTQCLLHCKPFRDDIELQSPGASFVGDKMQVLLEVNKDVFATQLPLLVTVTTTRA